MAKAHKFSASQVVVFPNVLKRQETIEPKIPGSAAPPPPPVSACMRVEIALPIAIRMDAMVIPCSRNSQCGVFMEEPPECLTASVDLGPEGCSVRGQGFEPCLFFKLDVREYTLELFDSVSNLSLHCSVLCFHQFSMLPGEVSFDLGFSVVDTRQLCQVVCQLISHSRHWLFKPSQLSSGLGDPRVDWLIINRRPGGLNLFCATTCAVGYAGEVLEFDVFKAAREGFIRLLECLYSGATYTFPRVTSKSQRSPQCICTTHSVPGG